MQDTGTLRLTTRGEREVVLTRVFDAPRRLVFDAMTRPELLKRWMFGPPGWSLEVCEIDLKVSGVYRYVWRGPDGTLMGMGGVHREIVPPERIVCTQLFDEDWTGGEAVGTVVLTESGGKTTLTNTIAYSSRQARDAALKTPMEQGMAMAYDRLAEFLASPSTPPGTRRFGEFCWINMLTPNPAEARTFFGTLLGWTYFEIPGIGHGIKVGSHHVGGLFDLESPQTPPGTRPHIGVMVKVESADATAARVAELGGKAKPAFDIMDQGRMAVCTDPNGAEFDVWQPKKMPGTDVDISLPGAPSWFETMTTDVGRAAKFYSGLFGWTAEPMPPNYTVFKLVHAPVAGMMGITPEMGKMRPSWWTYFTVKDVDQTAHEAVRLGGKICMPAKDIPGVGRICAITSPQGVDFYVIRYTR